MTGAEAAAILESFETPDGRIGVIKEERLTHVIAVLDVKEVYGRIQLRVAGVHGYGDSAWVFADRVKRLKEV